MSKLIIRTFYVKKWEFENMSSFTVCKEPTPTYHDDIQISWQEPERTVTITETEWDEVIRDTCYAEKSGWLADVLKKKLFDKKIGNREE